MSKRCKSLDGTDTYVWGTRQNPPTSKQQSCIDVIQKNLGIRFNGGSSKQAYEFIAKYYDRAVGR
jgi:hypothetical protein